MKRIIIIVVGLVLLGSVGGGVVWVLRPQPILPTGVQKQAASAVIVPSKSSGATIDKTSVQYVADQKRLYFRATYHAKTLVFSEQPSPDEFTDIPDVYTKLVVGMGQYDQFDTLVGSIYLTKGKNEGNKQVAVMNAKGTLLFIEAETDLSKDEWRTLGNKLELE